VAGAGDPLLIHKGRQWNPDEPHSFPITTLVRRKLAVKVGGFPEQPPVSKWCAGEDYPFWCALSAAGAKFSHFPEHLWEWNHKPAGGNTSGLGSRWK
jgi:hypothetical protein